LATVQDLGSSIEVFIDNVHVL